MIRTEQFCPFGNSLQTQARATGSAVLHCDFLALRTRVNRFS